MRRWRSGASCCWNFWDRRFFRTGSWAPSWRPRCMADTPMPETTLPEPAGAGKSGGPGVGRCAAPGHLERRVQGEDEVNARNRVFMILGLLIVGSLIWYFVTARPSGDLHLIGTVDANESQVSSKIPGRIQTLTVEEGQDVKAGDLIAVIESDDLAAAHKAAQATVSSQQAKLNETITTARRRAARRPARPSMPKPNCAHAKAALDAGAGQSRPPARRFGPHRRAGQAGNHEHAGQRRSGRQPEGVRSRR